LEASRLTTRLPVVIISSGSKAAPKKRDVTSSVDTIPTLKKAPVAKKKRG
jgi:hypothetical protein